MGDILEDLGLSSAQIELFKLKRMAYNKNISFQAKGVALLFYLIAGDKEPIAAHKIRKYSKLGRNKFDRAMEELTCIKVIQWDQGKATACLILENC